MAIKDVVNTTKKNMQSALEFTQEQFGKVRTGRASGNLVDAVKVDYYGSPTPLSQVASVSVPDARTIMIQPFDRNTITDVEKAIRSADLGFNPQNDGNVIRIPVPPLTEERRKEFVKLCKKYAEEGRVSVRNARREGMDELKSLEKAKVISEDERKSGEDEVQKVTDEYVKRIDAELDKKEKELLNP